MAGLLSIGLTGLNAAQNQLSTASHNITNANTAGFHRQYVVQTTQDPMFTGAGFFGNGTRIASVNRAYDQFLENQVAVADNRRAQYSAYNAQISQINNLLADPSSGLSTAMDGFFSGVQEVAANPTSIAARQALISSGEALVTRFQALDSRLSEIRQGVETEIASTVGLINSYAGAIAEMNQRITIAQSAGAGVPANDLLDQRGQLVAELNQLIRVTTTTQADGSLSVFVGSGQNLVSGNTTSTLAAVPSAEDPTRSSIALVSANGNQIVLPERLLTGGQLAGLLEFRSGSLDATQNRIGLIAATIASAFNEQHKLGVDLDGVLGQDFFRLPTPRMIPSGAADVQLDSANIGALTDSDYQLAYDGTNYTLTNLNSKASVVVGAGATVSFEGLTLTTPATASLAAGESALIQPTRFMARDIAMGISDTRKVAAGNSVSSNTPTTNAGNGKVSDIVINDVSGMVSAPSTTPNFGAITLTFDSATNSFSVNPAADFALSPASYNPATESVGKTFTLTGTTAPALFEFEFTISGSPANGDTFTLQPTEKGVADNRNATLLGALQTAKLLFDSGTGGTATLGTAYSQMVSTIGNQSRTAQVNEATQKALLSQASDARDSLSGVNLDEEAANLVRYQQAYQAAGRVMSIAQRLFDEVLSIGR